MSLFGGFLWGVLHLFVFCATNTFRKQNRPWARTETAGLRWSTMTWISYEFVSFYSYKQVIESD